MFLRASQSVGRHQELAADQTAAQHAGREATAAALRALPILAAAHTHYLKTYAEMGSVLEALPPHGEVHAGFRRMLAARTSEQLALLASQQRSSRSHPYDSHPPTAERIALIEELPTDGNPDGTTIEAVALTLLHDSDQVFNTACRTAPQRNLNPDPHGHADLTCAMRPPAASELGPSDTAVDSRLPEWSPQFRRPFGVGRLWTGTFGTCAGWGSCPTRSMASLACTPPSTPLNPTRDQRSRDNP